MIAVHDDFLYALDESGLLTISEAQTTDTSHRQKNPPTSYMILHRGSAIHEAKFLYPYIVFTTSTMKYDLLHVYDILQEYTVYSSEYGRDSQSPMNAVYAFSPSKHLFSYISSESYWSDIGNYVDTMQLVVMDTTTWKRQQNHNVNIRPSYMAISNTEKTIMLYDTKGTILYKNLYNGEIIKRVSTLDGLMQLKMNETRRFAVGISGNALSVVDLVNGQTVDTIVISSMPRLLFTMQNSNKIVSVGSFPDNSQIVQFFDFSNPRRLEEENALNIENDANISTLFVEGHKSYMGFENGSVSVYNMQEKKLNTISFDKSIANYDVHLSQNTLFFANADGIRSIPLSSLLDNTREENITAQFIPQMLISPIFASTTDPQPLPYVISRSKTTPLLFKLNATNQGQFSLSSPLRLSFVPNRVIAHNTQLFVYSNQLAKAQFIHYPPQEQNPTSKGNAPLTSADNTHTPHVMNDFLITHPRIAFDFNKFSELFTSAPLYEHTDKKAAPLNFLHTYRLTNNTETLPHEETKNIKKFFTESYTLKLPFSMDDVLFIHNLPSETSRRFIIARIVGTPHYDRSIETLLIDYPIIENNGQKRIMVLEREKFRDELSISPEDYRVQISGDIVKLMTFRSNAMFLTVANTHTWRVISHAKVPYPKTVSKIRSVHVTNSFIAAVDENNLAFVAKLDDFIIDIQWLMMLNETQNGRVQLLRKRLY